MKFDIFFHTGALGHRVGIVRSAPGDPDWCHKFDALTYAGNQDNLEE